MHTYIIHERERAPCRTLVCHVIAIAHTVKSEAPLETLFPSSNRQRVFACVNSEYMHAARLHARVRALAQRIGHYYSGLSRDQLHRGSRSR